MAYVRVDDGYEWVYFQAVVEVRFDHIWCVRSRGMDSS